MGLSKTVNLLKVEKKDGSKGHGFKADKYLVKQDKIGVEKKFKKSCSGWQGDGFQSQPDYQWSPLRSGETSSGGQWVVTV